jgi:RNA polymerase sigma-70 factor, ECF subfamily
MMNWQEHPDFQGSDEELRDLVLENPDVGWPIFLSVHNGVLRNTIGRFHLPREDAHDLLQEAFLALVDNDCMVLRNWDPARCSLAGYLSVITAYTCLGFLRSGFNEYNKRKQDPLEDLAGDPHPISRIEDPGPTASTLLIRSEVEETLRECLEEWSRDGLKEQDRLIIDFRLRGMSYKDVAELIDTSEENAMTRFSRLKSGLRKRLVQAGIEPGDAG